MSKFVNKTDATKTVKFSIWGATGEEMPRNAAKAEGDNVFSVKLNNVKTEIRKSVSRGGTPYFYTKLNDKWMWSQDDMSSGQEFAPYVKPEPAPKPPKVEKVKTEKPVKEAKTPAQPKAPVTTATLSSNASATPAKTPFSPPSAMSQVPKTGDASVK